MASASASAGSLNKLNVVPKPMNALQSMVQSTAAVETEAEASLAADKHRSPSTDVASSNNRDNRIVVNEEVVGPFGKSLTNG